MGRIIKPDRPCDHEGCGSSDANQIYEDYSSFCFSCRDKHGRPANYWKKDHEHYKVKWEDRNKGPKKKMTGNDGLDDDEEGMIESSSTGFTKKPREKTPEEIAKEVREINETYQIEGYRDRRIYKCVAEHYSVRCTYDTKGEIDAYYFPEKVVNNTPVSYSRRQLPKTFKSIGEVTKDLFGLWKYSGGKLLVITEGHLDAMSVQSANFKKYKKFYPVVSMGSCASLKNLIAQRDAIRKFDEVIFWADNDEKGQEIIPEVAKIIGYDKLKIARSDYKDANDLWLETGDPVKVLAPIWNASPYTPASVMTGNDLWDSLVEYNNIVSIPYPEFMSGINEKTKGMRFGDITLFISGTGSGKSSLVREVAWHVLQETGDKVGINALEEGPAETARKMAGLALSKNPAKEEIPLEELKVGFDKVFGENRVMVLDHQGSISDGSIMDHLEFMCLSGCKYIIIDHITILASEGAEGLTGNEAVDKIMNDLLKIAKKHNVWIGLISHLRKTSGDGKSFEEGKLPAMDDIKGSGSIKQISMDIIAFARDMGNADTLIRNTIKTKVLKCRYTGLTGPSGNLEYVYETGRIKASSFDPENGKTNEGARTSTKEFQRTVN
jgi:twinkle protein